MWMEGMGVEYRVKEGSSQGDAYFGVFAVQGRQKPRLGWLDVRLLKEGCPTISREDASDGAAEGQVQVSASRGGELGSSEEEVDADEFGAGGAPRVR